jgi:hypothetical protein
MQVWQLISNIHKSIDKAMTPRKWADVLLPPINMPPNEVIQSRNACDTAGTSQLPSEELVEAHQTASACRIPCNDHFPREQHQAGVVLQGCSFPPHFEPTGLASVHASVVAELVLEVRVIFMKSGRGRVARAILDSMSSMVSWAHTHATQGMSYSKEVLSETCHEAIRTKECKGNQRNGFRNRTKRHKRCKTKQRRTQASCIYTSVVFVVSVSMKC